MQHRDSPCQDGASCVAYAAHMDRMGDHAEDQHKLLATQSVSIAAQVGVPCLHADALLFLEQGGQDFDMDFLLASDVTVSPTLPAWPDHGVADGGCGPAPEPNDNVSALTFAEVVQPQKQHEEVHSPGVAHEQRQVMVGGRPETISSIGLSKFDDCHMRAAPFHNVPEPISQSVVQDRRTVDVDHPHAIPSNEPSNFDEFQIEVVEEQEFLLAPLFAFKVTKIDFGPTTPPEENKKHSCWRLDCVNQSWNGMEKAYCSTFVVHCENCSWSGGTENVPYCSLDCKTAVDEQHVSMPCGCCSTDSLVLEPEEVN